MITVGAKTTMGRYKSVLKKRQERIEQVLGIDSGTSPVKRLQFPIKKSELRSWDITWLELAEFWRARSKDPSTQVGCVIAKDKELLAFGYNGFPCGLADDDRLYDKEIKHKIVLHAEESALSKTNWKDLRGASVFISPLHPCPKCTAQLIQAKVARVVFLKPSIHLAEKYELEFVKGLLLEANIEIVEVEA